MSDFVRPCRFCVRCGERYEDWTVVQEALGYHGREAVYSKDGAFEVWDVCHACCEDMRSIKWGEVEEPPL